MLKSNAFWCKLLLKQLILYSKMFIWLPAHVVSVSYREPQCDIIVRTRWRLMLLLRVLCWHMWLKNCMVHSYLCRNTTSKAWTSCIKSKRMPHLLTAQIKLKTRCAPLHLDSEAQQYNWLQPPKETAAGFLELTCKLVITVLTLNCCSNLVSPNYE